VLELELELDSRLLLLDRFDLDPTFFVVEVFRLFDCDAVVIIIILIKIFIAVPKKQWETINKYVCIMLLGY
tara:strand:- start:1703 stop:1915 length:213 start_codon:yes stop_codon:yes gene_type:complete